MREIARGNREIAADITRQAGIRERRKAKGATSSVLRKFNGRVLTVKGALDKMAEHTWVVQPLPEQLFQYVDKTGSSEWPTVRAVGEEQGKKVHPDTRELSSLDDRIKEALEKKGFTQRIEPDGHVTFVKTADGLTHELQTPIVYTSGSFQKFCLRIIAKTRVPNDHAYAKRL